MDENELRQKVNKLLDFFTEPGGERYLKDLENDLMALIASYSREIQISDREVLIGMFEANKDNISVDEIIATLKGQVEAIKSEPEGKPNE